jgi:ketosteroid isomerase-like protein
VGKESPYISATLGLWSAFMKGELERWVQAFDWECELDLGGVVEWQGEPVFRGHDGLRAFHEQFRRLWDEFEVEVEDMIELGPERALLTLRQRGRMAGAEERIETLTSELVEVGGGRIVRFRLFSDRAEAMRAAGL